jgi:uncharacterized protein (TIGR03435 family)
MRTTAIRLLTLLAAASCLMGEVRVGQKAPALRLGTVLSGPPEVPSAGHALVIEFWATWCYPCQVAIPHLNSLVDRFRDRGVDFLSLTPEPEDTVRRFLRDHAIHGTVALDPNHANADAFGPIATIPKTVLIDSAGVIAAVTEPSAVDDEVLEALLAHTPLPLKTPDARTFERVPAYPGEVVNDVDAAARVVVRRVSRTGASLAGSDRYDARGTRLKSLLAFAYEIPDFRIQLPVYLADESYAVQAWVPPNHPETLKPLMQAAVTAGAGIQVRREERLTDVLVLTGMTGKLRQSSSALSQWTYETGTFSGDCTAEEIRGALEEALQKTVVLEHAPPGRFEFMLTWNPANPDDLEAALRSQLGLELKPARRVVPFLLVDSLDAVVKPEGAVPEKR